MILRRDTKSGSNDLAVVYRPCLVEEMLGNEVNKKIIKNSLDTKKIPHTQLFSGEPGCGKTTAARIVALGLNCEEKGISSEPCLKCKTCKSILEGSCSDVKEINVGQSGGKDYVDSVVKDLSYAPFSANYKVLIFDEAHELTTAAKDLLLKPIENGYSHVYFIFCTNQPDKLKSKNKGDGEPFLDRCTTLHFDRVDISLVKELLKNVCEFEGFNYNIDVLAVIAEQSKGVTRTALKWLNQAAIEGSWTISAINIICKTGSVDEDPSTLELCKALQAGNFKKATEIFEDIKNIPVETLRIAVTGYFVACLKRSKKVGEAKKYSKILDIITIPIYEQGKLGDYRWYNYMFKMADIILNPEVK